MKYEPGYVYHIKDEFFQIVKDDKLMKNREGDSFRPTYYCYEDKNTSLLWVIPMSLQFDKYKTIYDNKVEKYGKCINFVLGKYDKKPAVFLLQNMFPITEKYLDHIHTKNGNPLPVSPNLQKEIMTKTKTILKLNTKGIQIIFPDIKKIELIMLEQMKKQRLPLEQQLKEAKEGIKISDTKLKPLLKKIEERQK